MITVEDIIRKTLPLDISLDVTYVDDVVVSPNLDDFDNVELDSIFDEIMTDRMSDDVDASEDFLFFSAWKPLPIFPTDLFAVTSMLAKRTGAYSFVRDSLPAEPHKWLSSDRKRVADPFGLIGVNGAKRDELYIHAQAWRHGIIFTHANDIQNPDDGKFYENEKDLKEISLAISDDTTLSQQVKDELVAVCQVGFAKERRAYYDYIQNLWESLLNLKDVDVLKTIGPWESLEADKERLALFSIVLKLLIIADEACADIIEYDFGKKKKIPYINGQLNYHFKKQWQELHRSNEEKFGKKRKRKGKEPDAVDEQSLKPLRLNVFTNADFAPVLPKGRTTSLGCSTRSMSRNVCLAPIVTEVKATISNVEKKSDSELFNLLVIPFPFRMGHNCFKDPYSGSISKVYSDNDRWRWFEVVQSWLNDYKTDAGQLNLLGHIVTTLEEAEKRGGKVHGIVLPELAMTYKLFVKLASHLSTRDSLEMLISGTSSAPVRSPAGEIEKPGNFVCTAIFEKDNGGDRRFGLSVQHKHHRWKLTKQQIVDYGLAHTLDPKYDWWEHTNISSRTLNFWAFRDRSILSTLICEDLARNDPAQQALRAVGPNLIIALLMDAPQLKNRWPGRYAAMLADDPGASVLTLTSCGLMQDRKGGGRYMNSTQVALWSQPGEPHRELELGDGNAGILLNLTGVKKSSHSLDGRYFKDTAREWQLVGVKDVPMEAGIEWF